MRILRWGLARFINIIIFLFIMPKVEFKFDKYKDIWNYWSSANEKSQFLDFSQFINVRKINYNL